MQREFKCCLQQHLTDICALVFISYNQRDCRYGNKATRVPATPAGQWVILGIFHWFVGRSCGLYQTLGGRKTHPLKYYFDSWVVSNCKFSVQKASLEVPRELYRATWLYLCRGRCWSGARSLSTADRIRCCSGIPHRNTTGTPALAARALEQAFSDQTQGYILDFSSWVSTVLKQMCGLYLVFIAAYTSGVAQGDRTSDHEQYIVQTVEFVDQVAFFWSFIVLLIFSTSLQVLRQKFWNKIKFISSVDILISPKEKSNGHSLLCSGRTLTTGVASWKFTDSFLSKYEVTHGFTKDTTGRWTEGPRDWLGGFGSWDVAEDLTALLVGLNMAVCMRRISLSWSPDSLCLLDCRPCLGGFWGDDDASGSSLAGLDSGVSGSSAECGAAWGRGCLFVVRVGDTESSITKFPSSESIEASSSDSSSLCGSVGFVFVPTVSLTVGWVMIFKESCNSCFLGFLTAAVSPKVSSSVRSTSKSRASFSKDTTFLFEHSWFRNTKHRISIESLIKPTRRPLIMHQPTDVAGFSFAGSSVIKWKMCFCPFFLMECFRLSEW